MPLCLVSQIWNTKKLINWWYHQSKGNYFPRKGSSLLDKDINICSDKHMPSDRIISLFEVTLFSFDLVLWIFISRRSNATWAVLEISNQQTWQFFLKTFVSPLTSVNLLLLTGVVSKSQCNDLRTYKFPNQNDWDHWWAIDDIQSTTSKRQ